MTIKAKLEGVDRLDAILAKIPLELREKYIKRSIQAGLKRVTDDAAPRVPQPNKTTGGMEYTPRRGKRAARPMLHQELGQALRSYQGGENLIGIGGPQKRGGSRHAHLVERGFHHTVGGTFAGSGGRTRKSRRGDAFKGKGIRRAFIFPRPFLLYAWERLKGSLVQSMEVDLRRGVEQIARRG